MCFFEVWFVRSLIPTLLTQTVFYIVMNDSHMLLQFTFMKCIKVTLWIIFWWMERFWYFLDICCIWSMWESLFYDSVFQLSSDRSSLINICAPILTKIVCPLSKKNVSHISSKRTSDDPNWRALWAIFCPQPYDYIVYTESASHALVTCVVLIHSFHKSQRHTACS